MVSSVQPQSRIMDQVVNLLRCIDAACAERYQTIMAEPQQPSLVRKTSLITLAQQSVQQRSEAWQPSVQVHSSNHASVETAEDDSSRRDSGYRSKRISMFSPSQHRRALKRSSSLAEAVSTTVVAKPRHSQVKALKARSRSPSPPQRTRTPSPAGRCRQHTPDPMEQLDGSYVYDEAVLASKDGSSTGTPTRRSLENVLEGLSGADLALLHSLTLNMAT